MPFVTAADGVVLHYSSTGTGRPIVLVHGWTMNGRVFDRNIAGLAAAGYRVITVDTRCHGYSGKELVRLTLEQVAADLETVFTALDLHDIVLAGWSMGMTAVYNYVHQFGTGRLAGLVDIDMTPCLLVEDDWPHGVGGGLTALGSLAFQRELIRDRRNVTALTVPTMFAAGTTPTDHERDWWIDQCAAVPDLAALALWVSFTSQDWRPLLPKIDVPVLLVHGTASQIYPTPVWEALQDRIPQTELVLCEGRGHALFWEDPDRFDSALIRFTDAL